MSQSRIANLQESIEEKKQRLEELRRLRLQRSTYHLFVFCTARRKSVSTTSDESIDFIVSRILGSTTPETVPPGSEVTPEAGGPNSQSGVEVGVFAGSHS